MNRYTAAVLTAGLAMMLLTGCGNDAICGSDAYPVLEVNGTGRDCVSSGQQPPTGFTRFPAGKEPRHVDDQWDLYWRDHTVKEDGTIIEIGAAAPSATG